MLKKLQCNTEPLLSYKMDVKKIRGENFISDSDYVVLFKYLILTCSSYVQYLFVAVFTYVSK